MELTDFSRRQLRDICWGRGVEVSDVEERLRKMTFGPLGKGVVKMVLSLPIRPIVLSAERGDDCEPICVLDLHYHSVWIDLIFIHGA